MSEPARVPRRAAPPTDTQPQAVPRPVSTEERTVHFNADKVMTRRLDTGVSGNVVVESAEPGQVELVGLGREGYAEPGDPARFDVYETERRESEVRFTPAGAYGSRSAGKLVIAPPKEAKG